MLAGNHLAMICHRVHLIEEALAALEGVERTALDRALSGVDRFKRKLATPNALLGRTISRPGQPSLGLTCRHPWSGRRGTAQSGRRKAFAGGTVLRNS